MAQQISRPDLGEGAWLLVSRIYVCGDSPAIQTMMGGNIVQLSERKPGRPTVYEDARTGGFYFPDTTPIQDPAVVDHDGFPEPHRSRAIAWITGPGQTAEPMPIYTREQLEAADEGDAGLVYRQVRPAVNPPPAPARPGPRPPKLQHKPQVRTVRPPAGPAQTRRGQVRAQAAAADPAAALAKTLPPGRGRTVISDEASLTKAAGGVNVTKASE